MHTTQIQVKKASNTGGAQTLYENIRTFQCFSGLIYWVTSYKLASPIAQTLSD